MRGRRQDRGWPSSLARRRSSTPSPAGQEMERHLRAVVGVLIATPPRSNRPRPVDLEDLCTRIVYAVRRPRGRYCRTSRGISIKRTWVWMRPRVRYLRNDRGTQRSDPDTTEAHTSESDMRSAQEIASDLEDPRLCISTRQRHPRQTPLADDGARFHVSRHARCPRPTIPPCVTPSLHATLLGGASIRIPSVPSARREGTVGVVGCRGARRRSVVAAAVLVEHKFLHERALGAHVHTQAVRQGVQHRAKGGLARGHVDVHSFPVEHVQ